MLKINRLRLILTVALLLSLSACGLKVYDFQACAVVPGGNGVECDWFLHKDPEYYNEAQWQAIQLEWNLQGDAVECMRSSALLNNKATIEKACSDETCDDIVQNSIVRNEQMKTRALSRSKTHRSKPNDSENNP